MKVKVSDKHGFVLLEWTQDNGIPHVMRFPLETLSDDVGFEIVDAIHEILLAHEREKPKNKKVPRVRKGETRLRVLSP